MASGLFSPFVLLQLLVLWQVTRNRLPLLLSSSAGLCSDLSGGLGNGLGKKAPLWSSSSFAEEVAPGVMYSRYQAIVYPPRLAACY